MDRLTSSESPNPSQLEKLEFLNGVVQETMRIHASGMSSLAADIFALTRHNIVGINTRTALKDTSLPTGSGPTGTSPVAIPAGKVVSRKNLLIPFPILFEFYIESHVKEVMGLDSMHRRTEIFGSGPNDFRPHRWDNKWKPDSWTFLPSNRGTRTCLGKNLALMEVKFVLCRLLQAFSSIEMVEKVGDSVLVVNAQTRRKIQTKIAFNTKPAEAVWLRFRK